jgi:hypothetical protein
MNNMNILAKGDNMDKFIDDETRHKKKSKKKKQKKSDHKHEYEIIEKKEWVVTNWFTHIKVCKICGKVFNELYIEKEK